MLELLRQAGKRPLSHAELKALIEGYSPTVAAEAAALADEARRAVYGDAVFIRGLIEISNICKNDCYYCGIRCGNAACRRYRLTDEEILSCCEQGYALGFRTFVLQGGEDPAFSDERLCLLLTAIKRAHPDAAVTLSLGERSRESYEKLKAAGADRYLLRHETADREHYGRLHPAAMSYDERFRCLRDLRECGFQVGAGFMVGSPYQTTDTLAEDLRFIQDFRPEMCGIGPFIPHRDTPFRDFPSGSVDLTCYLLSLIRLLHPTVLLPATTALGTAATDGRERGIRAGANVVMPNLSPEVAKTNYQLYNNKLSTGAESAAEVDALRARMAAIGYTVVTDRGDHKNFA